ncbi:MAG: DUF434 domain-containing protein [Bacteroidota bacterium]|nr:DUF434 domain-containing protein [Bacteroidota bacterium]
MRKLTLEFSKALKDYSYLLEHGYPQNAALKLVGDRWKLTGMCRSILFRGIFEPEASERRNQKRVGAEHLYGSNVFIDTCNVLITLGSYLNGNEVFISTDGYVRDASEIHGKAFREDLLDQSLNFIFRFLASHNPASLNFYIDEPMSFSGRLAARINELLEENQISGNAQTCKSPDHILNTLSEGLIATSDTVIIDRCVCKIIDLPYEVLQLNFQPHIHNFRSILATD